MDNLKLYGIKENGIDSLVRTVKTVTKDIGMKFDIDKCSALNMKRGKAAECDGIVLGNSEEFGQVGE